MKKLTNNYAISHSESEWRELLTPFEYHVLREKGTERAFTGELYPEKREGRYLCRACGQEVFSAAAKYESGSGWPSYYAPAGETAVEEKSDRSHFMVRTEVRCARCGSHLGHLFEDGPAPTGKRYCINSASLRFVPAEQDA